MGALQDLASYPQRTLSSAKSAKESVKTAIVLLGILKIVGWVILAGVIVALLYAAYSLLTNKTYADAVNRNVQAVTNPDFVRATSEPVRATGDVVSSTLPVIGWFL